MAKRKLKRSITLAGGQNAKIHDHKATDLLRNAQVGPVTVDNPHGLEPGDKIVVLRSLRDDPLARMQDRRQIDQAQYTAGRYWQSAYELAEVGGARAIDPTREAVDGGQIASATISDAQARAFQTLAKGSRAVGMLGESVLRDVLAHGMFPEQVAAARGFANQRSVDFYSRLFRECLEGLAVVYGFAMVKRGPRNIA
jgi:hypothetical protein